jgi:large subunit ribosomal protein L24
MAEKWTKIRKDDVVMVIAGREINKSGRVLKLQPKSKRAIVEKINMIKRHSKPSAQTRQGGIIEKEGSIAISNVMVICRHCNAPAKIGKRALEDGSKVRVCRKCGEVLDK